MVIVVEMVFHGRSRTLLFGKRLPHRLQLPPLALQRLPRIVPLRLRQLPLPAAISGSGRLNF